MPQPYAQHLEKLMRGKADLTDQKESDIDKLIAQLQDKPDGNLSWRVGGHRTLIAVKHPDGILILQAVPGHLPTQQPIIRPIIYSKENAAWPVHP